MGSWVRSPELRPLALTCYVTLGSLDVQWAHQPPANPLRRSELTTTYVSALETSYSSNDSYY